MHTFRALGVSLPRLELARRHNYHEDSKKYYEQTQMRGPAVIRSDTTNLVNLVMESRAPLKPTAVVDAESICIAAGERAVVPARWDRGIPSSDFWVEGCEENQLAVEPGPCSGASYEVMLCIANESGMDIVLERGDPIAEAHEWILPPVSNGSSEKVVPPKWSPSFSPH